MSLAAQISTLATAIGNAIKLRMLKSANLSDVSNRQTAVNNLTNVSAAANEHILTKDTATGNAIFKVLPAATIADNAINYAKSGTEFKGDLTIASNAIDWASGVYAEITLTANQTYTFSNLEKGKTIIIRMTGAFVPTLPASCELVNGGTYNGAKYNYLVMTCVNSTTPKVLLSINKTA